MAENGAPFLEMPIWTVRQYLRQSLPAVLTATFLVWSNCFSIFFCCGISVMMLATNCGLRLHRIPQSLQKA